MSTFPDGTLVRSVGEPQVYVLQGGIRRWIPDPQTFAFDGFNWNCGTRFAGGHRQRDPSRSRHADLQILDGRRHLLEP